MKQKYMPLTDQLRQAILDCGQSQYAICKATGIDKTAMCRFINGERGVSMDVLNMLGEFLGLRLVANKPKAMKGEK